MQDPFGRVRAWWHGVIYDLDLYTCTRTYISRPTCQPVFSALGSMAVSHLRGLYAVTKGWVGFRKTAAVTRKVRNQYKSTQNCPETIYLYLAAMNRSKYAQVAGTDTSESSHAGSRLMGDFQCSINSHSFGLYILIFRVEVA